VTQHSHVRQRDAAQRYCVPELLCNTIDLHDINCNCKSTGQKAAMLAFVMVAMVVAGASGAPAPPPCNPETHMPAEYAIKEGAVPLIFLPQDKVNGFACHVPPPPQSQVAKQGAVRPALGHLSGRGPALRARTPALARCNGT
jgi:hypothetical protein